MKEEKIKRLYLILNLSNKRGYSESNPFLLSSDLTQSETTSSKAQLHPLAKKSKVGAALLLPSKRST